jgi:tRNA 2-thiocytidine biosynthesis protein TtcA
MTDHERIDRLIRFMLKKVNKAVYEFGMIQDGDRIAVALSGGKDSFSLLEVLRHRLRYVPEKYTVCAVHVVGDSRGPEGFAWPGEMENWLRGQGIEYLIRPSHLADDERLPMTCERCTWNRRRTLFEMAGDLGCNKIAFGHHLDDLAQTALLNLIRHGKNETMAPKAEYFGRRYHIIRPLMYVPEHDLKRFSSVAEFPAPPPLCPLGEHTQRQRAKDLIAEMRKDCRKVTQNLVRAALTDMYRRNSDPPRGTE